MIRDDFASKARALLLAAIMVLSVFAMSAAFAGGAAAQTTGGGDIGLEEGITQNVAIGSQPAELDRITINDSSGAVFSDETVLSIDSESGVTWASVENVQYAGDFVDFSISDDGQSLTVQHPDTSSEGDRIRIIGPGLNVDPDADTGDVSVDIDYAIGDATVDDFFSTSKPSLDSTDQDLSLGATDQPFSSDTLNISTESDAGEIGSEVVLTAAPDDGFSWNTTNTSSNDILSSDDGLGANISQATFSESEIRIPIDSGPSTAADTNVSFNAENITVDVAGDAENTTFGAAVVAANGNDDVVLDETYAVNGTSDTSVDLTGDTTVAIGTNNQSLGLGDVEINVTDTTGGNIGTGTNVTVSTDSDYVSFNETAVNDSSLNPDTPAIQNGDITVNVSGSGEDGFIEFNSTTIDVASNAPDGTLVNITATTQSSPGADPVTVRDTENSIELRSPDAYFNDTDNVELFVDNEGVTTPGNNALANVTINATTDDQFGVGENVTLALSDSTAGVTFNDSAGNFDIDGDVNSGDVVVSDDGTELTFNITDALSADQQLNISSVAFDVESGASNATLDVVVPTNDSNVDAEFDGQYTVKEATPDAVNNVSDDDVTQAVGDVEEVTFNVTSSDLDRAVSSNNQSFAGAQTEVALGSSPDDFDGSVEDVVTNTDLVTDTEGEGGFNFSSDTTGDYTVFVNGTESDVSKSFAFTVTSGDINSVDVEGAENAFRGGADDLDDNLQTGVYKVDLTDNEGNPVTTDQGFEFRVVVSGQTSEFIGLSDDLDDGTGTGATTTATPGTTASPFYSPADSDSNVFQYNATDDTTDEQGTFYVYVGNDLAEDIDVDIVPRGNFSDIDVATGTATFFSGVDSVDLTVDETLTPGEYVEATATASTSDGTQITVPRIDDGAGGDVFSTDNATVVDFAQQNTTDTAGVATANVSAGDVGTANLTANLDGVTDSTEVSVENLTADFQLELVDGPTTLAQNESFSANLTVTNEGDAAGTQDISYALENASTGDAAVSATESDVQLDAGNSTTLQFDATVPSDAEPGDYEHVFSSDDDEINASVTISEEGQLGTLNVTLDPQTVTANESTNVTVTVTDNATGDAVEGATVEISDLLQTETTDANGEATFTVNASLAGGYPVDVSASGFEDADATLTVEEAAGGEHPSGIDQEAADAVAGLAGDGGELSGGDLTILRGDLLDGDNTYNGVEVSGADLTLLRGWLLDGKPA